MKSVLSTILVIFVLVSTLPPSAAQVTHTPVFDGASAYQYLLGQCDLGPRPPGSENLSLCRVYIKSQLETSGWNVTLQNFTYQETACVNIVGTWHETGNSTVLLGAHYDTRPHASADPDPANRTRPILGANDGASGVAVLLELARVLPEDTRAGVQLVFFDAEDSGGINGWDWIQGSTYFVSHLNETERESISAMILVDMVGDANLRLPRESTSTRSLQDAVWNTASDLGYGEIFIDSYPGGIIDDHRPFLDAGIPALDIIQVPFPSYWHTLEDTPDKCSATSLEVVGSVLEVFLVTGSDETFAPELQSSFYIGIALIGVIVVVFCYLRSKRQ